MANRFKGKIISSVPPTSNSTLASGVWGVTDAMQGSAVGGSGWPRSISGAEILLVAGGGAGGGSAQNGDGGGGGGGVVSTSLTLNVGTYCVIVGAGGSGSNGSNTTFAGQVAVGGGRGGYYTGQPYNPCAGQLGGSGGGASGGGPSDGRWQCLGEGIAGQGNRGGYGQHTDGGSTRGGGGGGAGYIGCDATDTCGGKGGDGVANTISGTSITYAGGGGGGNRLNISFGAGGSGGGGCGCVAGTAYRGGGGGAGACGGSGIAYIKYPCVQNAASNTTGNVAVTTCCGYRIYTFSSTGTITFS